MDLRHILFRIITGIILFPFLPEMATASFSGISFRNVPVDAGLSQASVYCMLQDHKGFIWIGTKDGLNRYDGYEFITYKYDQNDPNSLSNNEIICLENENNEFLWIGTRSGGVNRMDFSTGHITRFNNLTYDDLVQSIVLDSLNNLWAGTSEGLLLFPVDDDGERNMVRNVSENALYHDTEGRIIEPDRKNISITSIIEIRKGLLLVGCEEGLFTYDISKNLFTSVSPETFDVTVFTSLRKDGKGNIWGGSYDGLFKLSFIGGSTEIRVIRFDTSSPEGRRLPVNWVEDLVVDHENNIWAGTRGAGLFRIRDEKIIEQYSNRFSEETSLPDDLINSLMIDRTGILWVGTESKGLTYTDLYTRSFKIIRPGRKHADGLSDNLVTALAGSNDRLWVGTAAEGIDVFAHNHGEVKHLYNLPRVQIGNRQSSREVMSLLVSRDGDIWIGSATNSLTVYNEKRGFHSYVVNGFVFSLLQDSDGRIWYGTWGRGLGYVDQENDTIESYYGTMANSLGLSSDKILSLFQDSNDLLWVGTKGGGVNVCRLERVVTRKGEFVSYRNDANNLNSISYNDIYDIHEDRDGNIWIATGSGLNRAIPGNNAGLTQSALQGTLSFKSYSEKDGLAGGLVLFIEEDANGNLWMGTNKGISRFDPETETFTNYGVNDGLPSGEFHINASFVDGKTGIMYFGGVEGVTVFHPDSLMANPFPSKVQLTGLRLHNQPVYPGDTVNGKIILKDYISYTDHLTLSHSNNEVTFEFSALHFSNPDKLKYAYRLKGFNDNWQETSSENRRATYTNLHEGDYVFEVRATNYDGSWSDSIASISITVNPPFWRTHLAYLFYFSLLVFLLITFRKYSLIGVKEKNNLIIESLEHKKDKELNDAKMKFFTNISHEIRTPLTLIYAPLQEILKRKDISPGLHEMLSVMHRNVKRLLNMVDQLLEFRKIDTGHINVHPVRFNLNELCRDTLFAFDSLAVQKGIETNIEGEEDLYIVADEKMVSTSIYNLLSNAFKFTPSGGQVTLNIEKNRKGNEHQNGEVVIRVCDTGPGIPESMLSHVFDRFEQVNVEGQEHHAGSGIGLSIVKEFIELNEGHVKVYNRPHKGCCFEIYLPWDANTGPRQTDADNTTSGGGMNEKDVSFKKGFTRVEETIKEADAGNENKRTICLVEDDVELASWLSAVFGRKFNVIVFHDGKIAMEKLPSSNPDIIVCDIMLPGVSGIELTKSLKSKLETSHIPVIMLTAKSGEDDMLKGLQTGADSYLTKPFNVDILRAQVDSLLASRDAFRAGFSRKLSLEPSEEIITPVDEKFLKRLMEVTEKNLGDPAFDVSVLVDEMNMSHSIILKKVKSLTGLSLVEFIRSMRIKKAAQIFRQDKLSVSEVSFMVGFSDPKYFSKCFSKHFGQKPTEYIKEHHS